MKLLDSIKNGSLKDYVSGNFEGICMKIVAAKPEIMLIVGGVSVLAGTLYAVKKAEEGKRVLDSAKGSLEAIDEGYKAVKNSCGDNKEALNKAKMDAGKSYLVLSAHTLYALLQVFGIPALLWFGGMGMIFGAHGELRKLEKHLIADLIASQKAFDDYRQRNAALIGEEAEKKLFMGAKEELIQVLEKDPVTNEEKLVEKKGDVFYAQPGSIFARNFTEETSDAFDVRAFAETYLNARVKRINQDLELGIAKFYNGASILRMLGFNEEALGTTEEELNALNECGISANGKKVQDPEMRRLKVTRLQGYREKWDPDRNMKIYEPCLRLDFNFYPLRGMM